MTGELSFKEAADWIADAELVAVGIGPGYFVESEELRRKMREELPPSLLQRLEERAVGEQSIEQNRNLSSFQSKESVALPLSSPLQRLLRQRYYHQHPEKLKLRFAPLQKLLAGKDSFLISTVTDGLLPYAGFPTDRMVLPCGREDRLQCSAGCQETWYEERELEKDWEQLSEDWLSPKGAFPPCPHCGAPLAFAVREEGIAYREEGYLPDWKRYLDWLSGTLRRKALFLELGENLAQPTVIRWPFEKMTYLNERARLIRVHKTLSQTPVELAGKCLRFAMDPYEWTERIAAVGAGSA